jgi:hypothetical protein
MRARCAHLRLTASRRRLRGIHSTRGLPLDAGAFGLPLSELVAAERSEAALEQARILMSDNRADSAARPRKQSVLLIGDSSHGDFAEPRDWLEERCDLRRAAGVAEACDSLYKTGAPHVILFAQSRPGQFSQSDVEQLHARSPLSRLVVLLGSWCEGEMRTGRPWSGVVRVYWHQWAARMIPELAAGNTDRCTVWRLPRTASGTEQLALAAEGDWRRGHGLVVIHTRLFCDYQAFSDVCTAGGYASFWDQPHGPSFVGGAAGVLCTAIGGDPSEAGLVGRLARRYASAPLVVLLDFLRGDDRQRMADAGAAAVLAKPFLVGDLLWHLDRHVRKGESEADATKTA